MTSLLENRRVAFLGKLGGVTKREAMQIVREHGGVPMERVTKETQLIIVGADHPPDIDPLSLLEEEVTLRLEQQEVELLSETEFWQSLGLVDHTHAVAQLYTPAMLADLVHQPIGSIRRWQNLHLLIPVRVVHRLPYFDFQQVQVARQIVNWLQQGVSLRVIQKLQRELGERGAAEASSLAECQVVVEGRQLLVRHDNALIEPSGQLRIDFDSFGEIEENQDGRLQPPSTLLFPSSGDESDGAEPTTLEQMQEFAADCEDQGNLKDAIEWTRAILAKYGPRADTNFQLAELLYREGETLAARERYFMAIELDEDFVEARANLGCVLAETGQLELAIAAFQGALSRHDAYPDVHYHLARALDDMQRTEEASTHWERFLELSPKSPWADEAVDRLQLPQ